jgi:hypothetical protein
VLLTLLIMGLKFLLFSLFGEFAEIFSVCKQFWGDQSRRGPALRFWTTNLYATMRDWNTSDFVIASISSTSRLRPPELQPAKARQVFKAGVT